MAPMDHYLTWVNAAWSEAARLRHRQIEPEHLLLGLIVQGGRAAAILGAHGVTLARARTAVDALADADLARVGIRLPEGLRPAAGPMGRHLRAAAVSCFGSIRTAQKSH